MKRTRQRATLTVLLIGQTISATLVILWVCSIGRQLRYSGDYFVFDLASNGTVIYYQYWWSSGPPQTTTYRKGFYIDPDLPRRFGLSLPKTGKSGSFKYIQIPLWMPLVAVALPTAILWYRRRRVVPGLCQVCKYNLTGNESGTCPECGTPIKVAKPSDP